MDQKQEENIKHENYQFLLGNDVRFAIVTALSVYNKPLNLTKLSKLTGLPTTTLIHHIPSLIDKNLIRIAVMPNSKRKFYELTEQFFDIEEFEDSEDLIVERIKKVEQTEKMSISEYKLELFKDYSDLIEKKVLTEDVANAMVTLAMFNKNIATFLSENMKSFVKNYLEKKTVDLNLPIAYPSNAQFTLDFSTVEQLQEFQKLNFTYGRNLIKLRKKIVQENKGIPVEKLEKTYLYLFVSPIFNIPD